MIFITLISESEKKDEGHKRTSSLGISEKRPHVLSIVGNLAHGSDVFMDKVNTECLIEYLEEELQTMEQYNCTECGRYESNLPKCDKCQTVDEYFFLVNKYALTEIGRELTQTEVDEIVEICNGYDSGNWGEEHLLDAFADWKKTQ